jgi:MOSC domain-containing protein YiiM
MTGRIVQVSVSRGGMPKRAVAEGLLTATGFEGDSWAHPQIHGGPNQTVLLLAAEAIERLAAMGYPVYPGALGENLTTEGLDPARWRPGQQYLVGEAVIELTKLRAPCNQLSVYGAGIQSEIKGDGTLGGFYARAVRPGRVFAGDTISLLSELA